MARSQHRPVRRSSRDSPAAKVGAIAEQPAFRASAPFVGRDGELVALLDAVGQVATVVDDLHELDDDSLALLSVVLRRLAAAPVAVVAALRPYLAAPNPAAEEMLERLDDVVRLELGTLGPADLAALVASILGGTPDGDLAAEVHRRADGNPFFAAEIARSLAESRLVTVDGGTAHL